MAQQIDNMSVMEQEFDVNMIQQMQNLPLDDRLETQAQYRDLLREARDVTLDGVWDMETVNTGIQKANEIFTSRAVLYTTEGVRDAEALKEYSEMFQRLVGDQKDEALQFNSNLFATKLIEQMKSLNNDRPENDDDEFPVASDWSEFGKTVGTLFKRAPGFHYLYGSFPKEARTPEERGATQRQARQQKDPNAPKTQPKSVADASAINESAETTKLVEFVLNRLKEVFESGGQQPIPYFEFVLDPQSFTQTIENMFHVSFLIRDAKAGLKLDDFGLPVLTLHDEVRGAGGRPSNVDGGPCNQCIIKIDLKQWRELVQTFKVKKAMLQPYKK